MLNKTDKLAITIPCGLVIANPATINVSIATLDPQYTKLIGLLIVGMLFTSIDVYTAWRLSRRVKKRTKKSTGKFKSEHGRRILNTWIVLFLGITLAFTVEKYVLSMLDPLYLPNWFTAAFCLFHGISILENWSSERENRLAIFMQTILINKASRHFDVDEEVIKRAIKKKD